METASRANKWNSKFLDEMRQIGDPEADGVIRSLFASGAIPSVNALFGALTQNESLPADRMPRELYEFFTNPDAIPPWTDWGKVERAEEIFMDHGLLGVVALLCASLPECYMMTRGVHVLWATQKLERHVLRRLFETSNMLVSVLTPGGLKKGGAGLRTAQKVRLLHASIRHLLLNPPPPETKGCPHAQLGDVLQGMEWDMSLGYPINQEDLAYTLLTFGYVIPRAMEHMGVPLTREDKEAFLHCWNVVGHVMGIRRDLLPDDVRDAAEFFTAFKKRQPKPCEKSQGLTAALIRSMELVMHTNFGRRFPHVFVRDLIGRETADFLAVPRATMLESIVVVFLRAQLKTLALIREDLHQKLPGLHRFAVDFGTKLVTGWTKMPGTKDRPLFQIPLHVQNSWKIEPAEK